MILVTAFQYDGSGLNTKAYNCACRTKETLPVPPQIPFIRRSAGVKLQDRELFGKLLLNTLFPFSFPHLEWRASISTWYLPVQKMTTESLPVEQPCASYPAEGHTDDFPGAFIFPREFHSQGWLLAKYAECHKPAALRALHPSWGEDASNCAEHLCQLLSPGHPRHSGTGLPSSHWHFCPKTSQ